MEPKRAVVLTISLDSDTPLLAAADWIDIGDKGRLDLHVVVHHGDDITAAPTGTPVGAWRLHFAGTKDIGGVAVTPVRLTSAESGTNSLADVAPNGNNLVNALANFTDVPGTCAKLLYVRASGGAGDKATVIATRS